MALLLNPLNPKENTMKKLLMIVSLSALSFGAMAQGERWSGHENRWNAPSHVQAVQQVRHERQQERWQQRHEMRHYRHWRHDDHRYYDRHYYRYNRHHYR